MLPPDNQRIRIEEQASGSEASSLVISISQVQRNDSGTYVCSAENQAGKAQQSAHLEVRFKPDLSRTKTLVKTWFGNTINVTCLADAIPNATILWHKGSERIEDRIGDRLGGDGRYKVFHEASGASSLQVKAIDNSVYADYRCQAVNQLGEGNVDIRLQEAFAPGVAEGIEVIKRSPQSVTFKYSPMAKDGGLPVTRYHVRYREVNDPAIAATQREFSWAVGAGTRDPSEVLHLDGLRSEAEYTFEFAAENAVGVGEFGNILTVALPRESQPEPVQFRLDGADGRIDPQSGDLLSQYSREYKIRWSEPNDNGKPLESYEITYFKVRQVLLTLLGSPFSS